MYWTNKCGHGKNLPKNTCSENLLTSTTPYIVVLEHLRTVSTPVNKGSTDKIPYCTLEASIQTPIKPLLFLPHSRSQSSSLQPGFLFPLRTRHYHTRLSIQRRCLRLHERRRAAETIQPTYRAQYRDNRERGTGLHIVFHRSGTCFPRTFGSESRNILL